MAKYQRKQQKKLSARIRYTEECRKEAVRKNGKLSGSINLAYKLPGSMNRRKGA